MKKLLLLFINLLFVSLIYAQIPTGYYDNAQGQSGAQLKTTLYNIIKNHSAQSYTPGVWNAFYTTDKKANGKVWDMYSDVPGGTPAYEWTFGTNQCGSYTGEGSCYNREHSFPKSWFYEDAPMVTDLFHIYPTDGYVNGKRSNYPFGEVSDPSWTSTNGSKLGSNSTAGYSGTVFEPIDEYKGDFARTYFYMATRYEDVISSWSSVVLDGSTYPVYEEWHLDLLIKWHEQDPVSQKETDRNNAVYDIQHNRNPFIDHPEYVAAVWGTATTAPNIGNIYNQPLQPSASEAVTIYATITDGGTITGATLNWGLSSGSLTNQEVMQANGDVYSADISAQSAGITVYYSISATDNDTETSSSSEYSYTVAAPAGVTLLPINEDFENGDLGIFSSINVVGNDQSWIRYTYSGTGNSYAKMSGWNGSGATPNEDWLVTPQIDFDSYINESLSFKTSMNYVDATTTFQILYSDNYSGSGDPNLADWTDLSDQAYFSTGDYTWVESGTIDLSSITGNEITFAFKYTCGTESETWQLDDINITGTAVGVGIEDDIAFQSISVYPNPAKEWIQLKGTVSLNSKLVIYNYLGQVELEQNVNSNDKLNISFLNSGIYILQIKDMDSDIQNFKLIIQ
ncbi:MAG: endonuclease [Bacteroidales bacterium]|nr:endonuclease [Bacteroidales bacterium]